ncbi:MAG: hypothetical protein UY72_C0059G0002 [Candidatus Uhrbacteria bacterium GW2011_GWD2_52_7]|uniref:Uncharacterized protein n=1 Tax=Candidatus Uhrbacteria bacterium GW2011_GWD2_52_7 TaxID=1618989 RepID=A0A0G1XDC3_9BACT|nr:MAG: hypothetical protein UY72_C0059G0002 [Candidatus Uhrbacteria bacterium GW2011_GWD2_52_7]
MILSLFIGTHTSSDPNAFYVLARAVRSKRQHAVDPKPGWLMPSMRIFWDDDQGKPVVRMYEYLGIWNATRGRVEQCDAASIPAEEAIRALGVESLASLIGGAFTFRTDAITRDIVIGGVSWSPGLRRVTLYEDCQSITDEVAKIDVDLGKGEAHLWLPDGRHFEGALTSFVRR